MGEQVRSGMAQDLDTIDILVRHDGQLGVLVDAMRCVDQSTIDTSSERCARKPGADGSQWRPLRAAA